MNAYLNIAITVAFAVLGVFMLMRYFKVRGKLIIQDKMWNFMRVMFGMVEIFALYSIIAAQGDLAVMDYLRIIAMVVACTAYMISRDGLAEEGLIHHGKLIPWNIIRAWDIHETSKQTEVYFTVESQNEKKPDEYKTLEIDFDNSNREQVNRFLKMNVGRKYTRMKRK